MSLDEIIDRERKRAFGFTDDRRCLFTYGDFRRLLMEIESAAKREECELLAQIAELRQKIDDGEFFTPKAARDAIAGERPLDEMLKAPLPTGNAAAMREALEAARDLLLPQCNGGTAFAKACGETVNKIMDALSALPRNGDVGTPEEQAERHTRFCLGQRWGCRRCPVHHKEHNACVLAWAQLPYQQEVKQGEDDDESKPKRKQ